jgi:hypothetical protein
MSAIFIISSLNNCGSKSQVDFKAEQIAWFIVKNIDTTSLNLIKHYNYVQRGKVDLWEKISGEIVIYSCSYFIGHDTSLLIVHQPMNFLDDYVSTFNFDTSRFHQFNFVQSRDTIISILTFDRQGKAIQQDTLISIKGLFPDRDPFKMFSKLTALKNKFKFIRTSYREDIGDFIVFSITPQYKLTYMPDTTKLNPKFKKYWLGEFTNGKKVNTHWSIQNNSQ